MGHPYLTREEIQGSLSLGEITYQEAAELRSDLERCSEFSGRVADQGKQASR